jgi:hypothetical protein
MIFQPKFLKQILAKSKLYSIEHLLDSVIKNYDKNTLSPMCIEFELYALGMQIYFPDKIKITKFSNVNFKILSTLYINPKIQNNNKHDRKGLCYTIRKKNQFENNIDINFENNKINKFLKLPIFEITRNNDQNECIDIFNNHEYFISYDPLTFLSIIAAMCGCVSIIIPIKGVSKKDYFKMTPFYQYMLEKNITEIYGLAYGINNSEIAYSKSTLHLVKDQIIDIQNWLINKYVNQFIIDIDNWDTNKNTLLYYKKSMREDIVNDYDIYFETFDPEFYKNVHTDLKHMSLEEATNHYKEYGHREKRLSSEKHFYEIYPNFDIEYYKNSNVDVLQNMSKEEIINYYHNVENK